MNFAPYQDASPEIERALSPPPQPQRVRSPLSAGAPKRPFSPSHLSREALPSPSHFSSGAGGGGGYQSGNDGYFADTTGGRVVDVESGVGGRFALGAFETSLPMRMDFEAMAAWLLLPPAGGVLLLLLEHKSDYVRFHAWQASLTFSALFVLHLLLVWSSFLSWLLFIFDIALIGFMTLRAYRDVDTLDHYQLPIFGPMADSFVDNE